MLSALGELLDERRRNMKAEQFEDMSPTSF